jgi:hypothetical protein
MKFEKKHAGLLMGVALWNVWTWGAGPAAAGRGARPWRGEQRADAFGQAATQAPQPMHAAASIAVSATSFGIRMALAVGRAAPLTEM